MYDEWYVLCPRMMDDGQRIPCYFYVCVCYAYIRYSYLCTTYISGLCSLFVYMYSILRTYTYDVRRRRYYYFRARWCVHFAIYLAELAIAR